MKHLLLLSSIFLFTAISKNSQLSAMSGKDSIYISHILFDPSGSDDGWEWIELYNRSSTAYNLTGHSLTWSRDGPGSSNSSYDFPSNTTVQAGEYLLIGGPNSDSKNGNPCFDITLNFSIPSPGLNNGDANYADVIALFDCPVNQIFQYKLPIDAVIYGGIFTIAHPGSVDEDGNNAKHITTVTEGQSYEQFYDSQTGDFWINGTMSPDSSPNCGCVIGAVCNDNDVNTYNDIIDVNCNCVGIDCPPGVIYVDASASTGGDGLSWITAFQDLQDAIDLASLCGSEIWVAQGTYVPTAEVDLDNSGTTNDQEKVFYIDKDIEIYGGFNGTESIRLERDWVTNLTIINGDLGITNDDTDNANHLFYLKGTNTNGNITQNCTIDGFQLEFSNADSFPYGGGAIYCDGKGVENFCSPIIQNCIFRNHSAGAILCMGGSQGMSSPQIINCDFFDNQGRAINCNSGNGVSNPLIMSCGFYNNVAVGDGAAVFSSAQNGTSNPIIQNCIFDNNAADRGGAIFCEGFGGNSNPDIINCNFTNNTANNTLLVSGLGGAIYIAYANSDIYNCSFSNNIATHRGGAIYLQGQSGNTSYMSITNSSFAYNSATNEGDAIYNNGQQNVFPIPSTINLFNSAFWDNGDEIINHFAETSADLSIVEGGLFSTSNIDPLFVDPANNNLRLQAGSPAINGGYGGYISGYDTDLAGNPRIIDGIVDIGAYEYLCHPDLLALENLYYDTNGFSWTNKTDWLSNCDPCGIESGNSPWFGLTCVNNRVTEIDLISNNLVGTIPSNLDDLIQLERLNLGGNQLSGTIPSTLGNLAQLDYLYLCGNQLTGSIPTSLGQLSNLEFLYLCNNELSGSIPNELGSLSQLKALYLNNNGLNNNGLTGEIPSELGNLTQLKWLQLGYNKLSGTIPPELGNLGNTIIEIGVSNNQLSGCYDPNLLNLCSANNKNFSNNSGLPDFTAFCSTNEGICCADHPDDPPINDNCSTAITVPIDGSATSCTWNATYSGISPTGSGGSGCGQTPDRDIWFQFTTSNCPTTDQFEIGVQSTDFTDRIQIEVFSGSCGGLTSIDCNRTQGTSYPQAVHTLSLSPNTTYLLRVWSKDDELGDLELYVNDLNALTCCSHPDYDVLEDFYSSTNGNSWTSSTDWLTDCDPCGEIDGTPWEGITCDVNNRVMWIILQNNNLTGALPSNIGDLDSLKILDVRDNNLGGTLPVSLGDLSNLEFLQLQFNGNISGTIPSSLGNLNKLKFLRFESNQLTGGIPASIGNIDSLEYFGTSENFNLGGTVPSSLGSLSKLKYLYLRNCQLTGELPPELGNLDSILYIQLNNNQLEGCFPEEYDLFCEPRVVDANFSNNVSLPNNGNFAAFCASGAGVCTCHPDFDALIALYNSTGGTNWTTNTGWVDGATGMDCDVCNWHGVTCDLNNRVSNLTLFNNDLNGTLPAELGNLDQLKTLYLGNNTLLVGSIPPELGNLSNLGTLNLTSNSLTGSIPSELGNLNVGLFLLSGNDLSGNIPSELGNLSSVVSLSLYRNQLTGSLPKELAGLTNLTWLRTYDNNLNGCYPPELSSLCTQLAMQNPDRSTNANISDGNNFNADWEDFCDFNSGECDPNCPQTVNLFLDPVMNEQITASDTITSTVEIASGLTVEYKAGEVIILRPPPSGFGVGFHAINGSEFHAVIEDCSLSANENVESRTEEVRLSRPQLKVYPNPFSNTTTVEYKLESASQVEAYVLDITGRIVEHLLPLQQQEIGRYQVNWSAEQQQVGLYFLHLRIGEAWMSHKLVVLE